jgi:hypothetical protein
MIRKMPGMAIGAQNGRILFLGLSFLTGLNWAFLVMVFLIPVYRAQNRK